MPNNDLISRKQAIHFLKTLAYDKDMSYEGATAVCMAWGGIDRMPAVDAEPVRHGKWIENYAYGAWHYDCPFCDDGYATKKREKKPVNYCHNCGAKLDKEKK